MSFVKVGGEGSGEAAAKAALQELAQVGAKSGGETVAHVAGGAAAAAHAAGAIGALIQAGSEGSSQSQAAMTPGIASGGAVGAGAGVASGATPGFAGGAAAGGGVLGAGAAGIVGGIFGAPSSVGAGVVGAVGGIAGGVGGAQAGVAGAVGGIAGIAGGIKGAAAGGISGAAAGVAAAVGAAGSAGSLLGGAGGGIAGAASGGIAGMAGKAGLGSGGDLPFFDDIAVTSTAPGAAVSALGDELQSVIDFGAAGVFGPLSGRNLEVEVASGDALDIREFSVRERLSSLFEVKLTVVSDNPSIDFDSIVGLPAIFSMHAGIHDRSWSGVCNHFEQVKVEHSGVSTYQISIVPSLWLLTQRKNYRIFQQISEPDIVLKVLKEWDIDPQVRIDRDAYKTRKYRVQYAESDFDFISRMLEDSGVGYYFEHIDGDTKLVLSDAPQSNPKRRRALAFVDDASSVKKNAGEIVTRVHVAQRVRPGKVTLRDHDYRRPPAYKLLSTASAGRGVEEKLERYHYTPGAFLFGTDQADSTPVADDKGRTRTDEKEGAILAQKRLDAKRGSARVCTFETNAHDLSPGVVMSMSGHPNDALGEGRKLLLVECSLRGSVTGDWTHQCEARGTDIPFRPDLATPKPKVNGVESATVVGPKGEEIHTDEFGRVRVHFHWDRESKMNDDSSCWIHVSQPWGGTGYGGVNLPRVGQEVLVDFLGGDPDRPIIVGRVYTNLQKVPYKLPANKTQSGWRSNSTGGGGGYNELMFEDAQGKELVHMQAEKDYTKVVKNNQASTVLGSRSASVTGADSVTVGKSQTNNVVASRTSMIGASDSIDAGESHSATVGDGVGYVLNKDKTIKVTNGVASVVITPDGLFLDAKGTLHIRTDGLLKLSGAEVQIDGGPQVLLNCSAKESASVPTLSKAKGPSHPSSGGRRNQQRGPELGSGGEVESPTVPEPLHVTPAAPGLSELFGEGLPLSPNLAPPMCVFDEDLLTSMKNASMNAGGMLDGLTMVKDNATGAMTLYQLAKGESLASLPSTMDVLGPMLPKTFSSLGDLGPADIGALVNAGNQAGVFHVGSSGNPVSSFMALRTAAAPHTVSGDRVSAEARLIRSSGAPLELSYSRALEAQGISLYQMTSENKFMKL